ncbi:MAG: MFS transporter [Chitinophagia bacterium]|jgi:MFS family permease|nr:MFS transporter [Chitinophagia bacterium]NCA29227.1 MFS transporter [Chitinophagia bacterium]NDD16462.1 MFS transporter [Chitinophagia bacterium]
MSQENKQNNIAFVIGASSVGTLIEWYDFYIFGMLATIISKQFFPANAGTAALLSTLAIFAAGFIVRPFGALVFGRLGDLIGRKHTFLLTLIIMGGSTFAIGLVPGYATIGWAAPILVLILRLLQGLALGGEYGGAATYVAEHAPAGQRGFWTSWIQTTATLGLFLALGIIILIRTNQGVEKFSAEWGGWRYPFWISILLVGVSVLIRMRMSESPMFSKLKTEGKTSTNPLKESFGHKANFKMVLLALFGAVMGQGVVWYTGQFYAQSFIETVCKVEFVQSRNIMLIAILMATPCFVLFGWLSDKVGRKWIMLIGMLAAVFTYRPIYKEFINITSAANRTKIVDARLTNTMTSYPIYDTKDKTKMYLKHEADTTYFDGSVFKYYRTDTIILKAPRDEARPITLINPDMIQYSSPKPNLVVEKTLGHAAYWDMIWLVFIQIVYVTMVYGPIAAFLVEMFPTKIRYTSMSLPYHIGNGVFGGLVPFLGTLIVEFTKTSSNPTGDSLAGLWYPIGVASICFIIGLLYLTNKIDKNVMD